MYMILPCIHVASAKKMGMGVFTSAAVKAGTVIEQSPVIVMKQAERKLLDQTLMHDYIFEWGESGKLCCVALGYVSIYNHSFHSNCEYEMEFHNNLIRVTAMKDIQAGEQLFVNYNGTFNNSTPLWFPAV